MDAVIVLRAKVVAVGHTNVNYRSLTTGEELSPRNNPCQEDIHWTWPILYHYST